jgi:predicted choloylglycine hydrolase
MRNLDWLANTGVNKNKLITVWNVDGSIPHMTLGFPGVWGALTGMSKAGLTVHEAGLSSRRSSEVGFQWTLRMRYIMMNARTLDEATRIWSSTKNALGMNFMITSGRDNIEGKYPAIVMETMRGYTAYFYEHDKREDGT